MISDLEKFCHFIFRGISFCLQEPEHIYDAAVVEALKESPAERDEDTGTIRVPITPLFSPTAHEWTQICLYFSP